MHTEPTVSIGANSTHIRDAPKTNEVGQAARSAIRFGLVETLRRSPELASDRSFIIEKAVDEFLTKSATAPTVSPSEFSAQFAEFGPSIQSSIYRQLEVECFLKRHSWLKGNFDNQEWPSRGDTCGSFLVVEEIGHGAIARVYLCRQPDVGDRQVIVKVSESAFLEADILGRLRHPNIVPIHSLERDPTSRRTMLCMPFLGRSTLHDFLDLSKQAEQESRPTLQQAARVWEQPTDRIDERACPAMLRPMRGFHDCVAYMGERLSDALAHAHRNGIVHGDIKPSNILLSRDGEPLLMDFNLSGDAGRSVAAKGGTLPYMPPEQLQAVLLGDTDAIRYGAHSDVFSLGVVLYEALAGRAPFPLDGLPSDRTRLADKLLERQRQGCVPLRSLDGSISASLADTIQRCLNFQPHDRLDADELRTRLESENRVRRRAQRHLVQHCKSYVQCAALMLAACLAFAGYQAQRPPKEVRLLQQALALQQDGDLDDAEALLSQAVLIRPSYHDARFALARGALLKGDVRRASKEFFALWKVERSPRAAAYIAYCFNVIRDPTSANVWYEKANELGCDAPEVQNNLAVSYELGDSRLSEAERLRVSELLLRRALKQQPDSPQIRLNWICLAIRRAHIDGTSASQETLEMCRQLARESPNVGFVLERAACAFATASEASPELRDEGVAFLRKAFELGHGTSIEDLESSAQWEFLRRSPAFEDLIRDLRNPNRKIVKSDRLARLLEPTSLAATIAPAAR
jgi:serine/threonine protein kinase/TPR repeat protein